MPPFSTSRRDRSTLLAALSPRPPQRPGNLLTRAPLNSFLPRGTAPAGAEGSSFDAETRQANGRLAHRIASRAPDEEAFKDLLPIFGTALRDDSRQASREIEDLVAQLAEQSPDHARQLMNALPRPGAYNRTPRITAYDIRKDPLFGGRNEEQAVYFAKRAVPPIPQYFDRVEKEIKYNIEEGSPQWPEFHETLIDAEASALEHLIFRTLFSHEGGLRPDMPQDANYPSVGGITEQTLRDLRKSTKTRDAMAVLGIASNDPRTLTNSQRIEVMRIYLDDVMRAARIGASNRRSRPVTAIDLLAGLGNAESAVALADTLFRSGGPKGIPHVQNAINAFYAERGLPKRVKVDDAFGSETYGAYKAIIQDPTDRKLLLDLLANFRTGEYPVEYRRFDYHRLP